MRLLFQWEEDPQSTPGMISRKGGQAGRGDGECGLAARDRHPEERPGYPPRSPDSSASVPAALRGSSVPGVATAAPYASPSHRVLWQATHFLLSLRSDSGGQDQDLAPQCPPQEGCPVHGNFSVPFHSPPAPLFKPTPCLPQGVPCLLPWEKSRALSPALRGLWSFHWGDGGRHPHSRLLTSETETTSSSVQKRATNVVILQAKYCLASCEESSVSAAPAALTAPRRNDSMISQRRTCPILGCLRRVEDGHLG